MSICYDKNFDVIIITNNLRLCPSDKEAKKDLHMFSYTGLNGYCDFIYLDGIVIQVCQSSLISPRFLYTSIE